MSGASRLRRTIVSRGIAGLGGLVVVLSAGPLSAEKVTFNRDIRPIIADKCFTCHGPDDNQREADLRLDVRDAAVEDRGGYQVVVPGEPEESELLRRIASEDEDERMPPDSAEGLSADEIDKVRRWIAEGAEYQEHWSLIPPRVSEPPAALDSTWPRNEIDAFVLARLRERGLQTSPEADRRTLLRRLSFDLTGLPPTSEEVDAFLCDNSDSAYEKVVDRLLASRHFGERMAMYWLDVVRYADSGGYHSDNHRDVSLYRDYVIHAFNDNLPFDQMTVEQIAGDLLPEATPQQRIASGYNRLLQTTEEGGAQPKEYTAKYQADRVRNTAAAWLGITMGCCECHNHKFDPFTIKDFYSFAAFFADIQEKAVGRQDQAVFPTPEQEEALADLEQELAAARQTLQQARASLNELDEAWVADMTQKLTDKDSKLPDEVRAALETEADSRSEAQIAKLIEHYREVAPQLAPQREQLAALTGKIKTLQNSYPKTLVSVSVAPRTVRMLPRGNWQDDSGEIVEPATPEALPAAKFKERREARLALGRWMVSPENPLVPRVKVNRLWKLLFGRGIVESVADFGTQGAWPSHPELLDWLALDFVDSGWDVKRLMKKVVMSRTYQQSSRPTPDLAQQDPDNRWLARQGRFRLDAEMVRDNALAVSGLLSPAIGGSSVKPYQPAGYWQHLNFPKRKWTHDRGDGLYRRGLYTYWQRTFLHPSLAAFDAPSREECTVDRPRSNTPLQALVLLNDPTYVEAARALAARMLVDGGETTESRLEFGYRLALNRSPSGREREILADLQANHLRIYEQDRDRAQQAISVGDSKPPSELDVAELAAWTSVARAILNLHETITRY